MDYVPAKILSKQASVYSPTSDAMSGYALAVRHDRLDYSVTKGGLRLWIVVIVFILLISGLVTVFSNKELDFEIESEETSEERTSGELLQREREILERKIELHKAKKRKKITEDDEDESIEEELVAISDEISKEEEFEIPVKAPKIRSKQASEEEERRLRELSEKAEAKRRALEKETADEEEKEDDGVGQAEEHEEEAEEEEKEEEEVPIVKHVSKKEKAPSKIVKPKEIEEPPEEEEEEEEIEPVPVEPPKKLAESQTEPSTMKKEPESPVVPPTPKKKEIKPVKVFKTKGKAKEERHVIERPSEEPEIEPEEEEETEEETEPQEEKVEHKPAPVPKKISKPAIPIKTFRTKGREKGAIEYITSFFKSSVEEEEEEAQEEQEEERLEERYADEETCEAGAKCEEEIEQPPPKGKIAKKEPIKIRYTRKKGRDPEDRFDSERHLTESFASDDDSLGDEEEGNEEKEDVHEKPQKPLIPVKVFRTKGGAEREPIVVERMQERKKPLIPIKTFRTKGSDVVVDDEPPTKREEKPKKPVVPVKVFRTKGGDERKPSHDDDERDEVEDFVALKIEKKMQKTAPPAYRKHAITNREDNKIRTRLDQADRLIEERELDTALVTFDQIIKSYPSSPRAHYGRARTLDLLSELKQSNSMLEDSIREYELILDLNNIPDELYVSAANRLVDRSKFRGWVKKALDVQRKLVDKYPDDLHILNDYGVTFLIMGRNDDAKKVFETVLVKEPDNGFALAHYGFILKTAEDNLEDAVDYLRRGISSGEYGTQDGRFFFQLGDALQRLNRSEEAYDVYDEGAQKGLFLSKLQRSLYNVEGLTARPWWTPEQTTYLNHLKAIENEWRTIKEEGVALLDQKNVIFKKEDERLTNRGDWRQFTLYLRGKKNEENCAKAPKTCALVEKFPEAVGCTRGQIKFSVMEGGTKVWPHCGPTNCRLRGHLGLIVPPDPRIKVGNETRAWKRGKFIIFDDSFEHEVWYEGSGFRLVLIVDFWHPELTPQQRASLTPI